MCIFANNRTVKISDAYGHDLLLNFIEEFHRDLEALGWKAQSAAIAL